MMESRGVVLLVAAHPRLATLVFSFDHRVKTKVSHEGQRSFMGISAVWDANSVDSSFVLTPTHGLPHLCNHRFCIL